MLRALILGLTVFISQNTWSQDQLEFRPQERAISLEAIILKEPGVIAMKILKTEETALIISAQAINRVLESEGASFRVVSDYAYFPEGELEKITSDSLKGVVGVAGLLPGQADEVSDQAVEAISQHITKYGPEMNGPHQNVAGETQFSLLEGLANIMKSLQDRFHVDAYLPFHYWIEKGLKSYDEKAKALENKAPEAGVFPFIGKILIYIPAKFIDGVGYVVTLPGRKKRIKEAREEIEIDLDTEVSDLAQTLIKTFDVPNSQKKQFQRTVKNALPELRESIDRELKEVSESI